MSASQQEAVDIVQVVCKYLPREKASAMAEELVDKVGARSDNESLRTTLDMLDALLKDESLVVNTGRNYVHSISPGGLKTYGDHS
jgi:hypothetical protein